MGADIFRRLSRRGLLRILGRLRWCRSHIEMAVLRCTRCIRAISGARPPRGRSNLLELGGQPAKRRNGRLTTGFQPSLSHALPQDGHDLDSRTGNGARAPPSDHADRRRKLDIATAAVHHAIAAFGHGFFGCSESNNGHTHGAHRFGASFPHGWVVAVSLARFNQTGEPDSRDRPAGFSPLNPAPQRPLHLVCSNCTDFIRSVLLPSG